MEIRYENIINQENIIKFDHLLLINGANKCGKTYILKELEKGFNGELDNFYINGNKVYKSDYKVIYIGDYNNFATDFKLTKANQFKKIIYEEIIDKIDTDNLFEKVNNIFSLINNKVNKLLDIDKNLNEFNLKLNIQFDNLDKVIEKFTNIYIDEYLLDENKTPRSTLRRLLYNLVMYDISKNNENVVVIIDDVDNSLDEMELKKIVEKLENDKEYEKITFICSTCRNIYSYIKNKSNIYKCKNKLISNINSIDNCIKHSIILNEYNRNESKEDFNVFFEENEHLINDEDINYFNKSVFPFLENTIGLLYCCDNIEFTLNLTKTELEKVFINVLNDNLNIDNN